MPQQQQHARPPDEAARRNPSCTGLWSPCSIPNPRRSPAEAGLVEHGVVYEQTSLRLVTMSPHGFTNARRSLDGPLEFLANRAPNRRDHSLVRVCTHVAGTRDGWPPHPSDMTVCHESAACIWGMPPSTAPYTAWPKSVVTGVRWP